MTEQKQEFRPVRTLRRWSVTLAVLVLVAAVCFGLGFVKGGSKSDTPPKLDAVVVQNRIEQMRQLATAKYYYTNMGQFEQHGEFYGVKLPFTTKRFIVSYDGVILAGVDLSDAEIDISDAQLTVTLPKAIVLSHEMEEESLQIFDETRNIFNPITIEDYNGFLADQKDAVEAKAVENGLLDEAVNNARAALTSLLQPMAEEYGLELVIMNGF